MQRDRLMWRFDRQSILLREYFVLLGTIIISLILIFSNDNRQLDAVRRGVIDFVGILQEKIFVYRNLFSLAEKNKKLREQNTYLALENSQLKEAMQENIRLRQLIGFKEAWRFDLIPGKVIGYGSSGVVKSITLDVGKEEGVRKNMPLVVAEGLVGKVYQVSQKHSLGHLLVDRNFRVSAKVQRSRVNGIVSWIGGATCRLNGVPKRSDVKVGDAIVTSGYGSIFPPGLKIGTVTEVSEKTKGLFMKIHLKPKVDFGKLEEVFIIKTESANHE